MDQADSFCHNLQFFWSQTSRTESSDGTLTHLPHSFSKQSASMYYSFRTKNNQLYHYITCLPYEVIYDIDVLGTRNAGLDCMKKANVFPLSHQNKGYNYQSGSDKSVS
ncbi:hypothetical protein Tco_1079537 [Tanacetum coccineum]|uniref:Uncharacterized protein n=1 Tax=Tanacetum coccineum TaxID=301880 RepID=A0ABQ5HS42_9ASTR